MTAKIWLRRNDESAKAYEAAQTYFELGANRSLDAVSRKYQKSIALISRWSQRHGWVARAQAYDEHQLAIQEKAREEAAKKKAEVWEERRAQEREWEYVIARRLYLRAAQILKEPLSAAKFSHADAARIADTAAKLARLAADMATAKETHEITGKDGGAIEVINAASEFDNKLLALFERATKDSLSQEPQSE